MSRCLQNHRSLVKKGKDKEFQAALSEYQQLGHAEEVPANQRNLPTTSTGASLNDTLHQGPNLYPLLSDVLLRFWSHNIGFTADISKMFWEIKLYKDERDLHRFLSKDSNSVLTDRRMLRLTFGVRCSPFIATQVLRHLAAKNTELFPLASQAIERDFYVDDYLSRASTIKEAEQIQKELCELLHTAGMTLRKWRSSSKEFLKTIPSSICETENMLISPSDRPLKTLGLHWDVNTDKLTVAIPTTPLDSKVTKRIVASTLGKVYDLLGFSPQ